MKLRGFTLIEVLVSVAIFSTVMVIALGALLAISTSNRKAESLKSVINNLNFSVDSMARALRTGSGWRCAGGTDCPGGANSIDFVPQSGIGRTYYRLETSSGTLCNQTAPNIGCLVKSTDNVNWTPITAPEVIITDYSAASSYMFYVVGNVPSDAVQPKVVITISGYVRVTGSATSQTQCNTTGNQCSVFRLQTTVTQRLYDQ